MLLRLYSLASVLLTAAVVHQAYVSKVQLFLVVQRLLTWKFGIFVLANQAIMFVVLAFVLLRRVFLGRLRANEEEFMYENVKYAITNTIFALATFRASLNLNVACLFVALMFMKIFHWLCKKRQENLEISVSPTLYRCATLLLLLSLLLGIDFVCIYMCAMELQAHGPSVLILFGFESLVFALMASSVLTKVLLHLYDVRSDSSTGSSSNGWDNKAETMFVIELVTEVLTAFFYIGFFGAIFTYYGWPLHIIHELFTCVVRLYTTLMNYLKYRRLVKALEVGIPNATAADLSRAAGEDGNRSSEDGNRSSEVGNRSSTDPSKRQTETDQDCACVVCREAMVLQSAQAGRQGGGGTIKKLPCSHMFHLRCLRVWVQRQQNCPTCRQDILASADDPAPVPAVQVAAGLREEDAAPLAAPLAESSATPAAAVEARAHATALPIDLTLVWLKKQLSLLQQQQQILIAEERRLKQQQQQTEPKVVAQQLRQCLREQIDLLHRQIQVQKEKAK
jgi:E3 ubiquitin-protein ligase synoviolin